jgi:hypothetical protein
MIRVLIYYPAFFLPLQLRNTVIQVQDDDITYNNASNNCRISLLQTTAYGLGTAEDGVICVSVTH